MNGWIPPFVVVVTIEIVLHALILAGVYYGFRQASRKMNRLINELQRKAKPILLGAKRVLKTSEEEITSIMTDVAEINRLTRGQAQAIGRVVVDALERMRLQLNRADAMFTNAFEAAGDASVGLRCSVFAPFQQSSAVLTSIRSGIDFIRRQRVPRGQPSGHGDLFIPQPAGAELLSEPPMENDSKPSAQHPVCAQDKDSWSEPRPQNIPRPTYSPALLALAIVCLLWGMVTTYLISLLGAILFVLGLAGWIGELRHEHESR